MPQTMPVCLYSFQPEPTDSRARRTRSGSVAALHEHARPRSSSCGCRSEGNARSPSRPVVLHEAPKRPNQKSEICVSTVPLSGMPGTEHGVERGDPIGRHEQQIVVDLIDVAYLAAAVQVKVGKAGVEERGGCDHVVGAVVGGGQCPRRERQMRINANRNCQTADSLVGCFPAGLRDSMLRARRPQGEGRSAAANAAAAPGVGSRATRSSR